MKRKKSKEEKLEEKEIKETVDAFVHPKYQGFNAVKLATSAGIVTGLSFMITLFAHVYRGGFPKWAGLITEAYGSIGVNTGYFGGILGGIYGFIDAFIVVWLFAKLYNLMLKK